MKTEPITEVEETRRGEMLASGLKLKPAKRCTEDCPRPVHYVPHRYETAWGTKTALGLFRTIERIIIDGDI